MNEVSAEAEDATTLPIIRNAATSWNNSNIRAYALSITMQCVVFRKLQRELHKTISTISESRTQLWEKRVERKM